MYNQSRGVKNIFLSNLISLNTLLNEALVVLKDDALLCVQRPKIWKFHGSSQHQIHKCEFSSFVKIISKPRAQLYLNKKKK